jgi:3-dehydroquinate synthase class II
MQINRNEKGIEVSGLLYGSKWAKRFTLEQAAQLRRLMKEQHTPLSINEYNLGDRILKMTGIEARAFAQFYDAQFGGAR